MLALAQSFFTPYTGIRELIDIDDIVFNGLEINLLNMLHKAYKENDNLGIFNEELILFDQRTIYSLVNRKFIAYAQGVLSLTIFGYNYCVNKK